MYGRCQIHQLESLLHVSFHTCFSPGHERVARDDRHVSLFSSLFSCVDAAYTSPCDPTGGHSPAITRRYGAFRSKGHVRRCCKESMDAKVVHAHTAATCRARATAVATPAQRMDGMQDWDL